MDKVVATLRRAEVPRSGAEGRRATTMANRRYGDALRRRPEFVGKPVGKSAAASGAENGPGDHSGGCAALATG